MSKESPRIIALTGPPGCGKTTLVKKVCSKLIERNFALNGFYTEEIRTGRERVGFDVVLLDGRRAPLARVERESYKGPKVGKYAVYVDSFESSVLPIFQSEDKNTVLVLDEIGKMELLSEKFSRAVSQCVLGRPSVVLATVPEKSIRSIPIVDSIKSFLYTRLLTVNKDNRNDLVEKVTDLIISAKEKYENE